jgi:carbon-monoxide dehydrogenase medium subunit
MLSEAEYHRPTEVESACRLRDEHRDAVVVAGGQSLSLLTREGVLTPETLVDINHIDSLDGVAVGDDGIRIGATTTHRDIETSDLLADRLPTVVEAASGIADVQVRNAGTMGGVAAHADPAADYLPVLLALDATIKTATTEGTALYDADEFFTGRHRNVLDERELVTEIHLPTLDEDEDVTYEKLAFRENDWAVVNAAAYVAVENGVCADARIAVGATTDAPLLAEDAAASLVDGDLTQRDREAAAAIAREEVPLAPDPSVTEEYRSRMVERLVGNAIEAAAADARGNT